MRHVPPIVPSKSLPRALYETLRRINQGVQDAAASSAALGRGEVPDGSGTPISSTIDLSQYFFLPGRAGFQKAFGATAASGYLQLSSTFHATKGLIYLGSAQTSMFDEVNSRLGLNRVPLFRLHQAHSAIETMQRWEGPANVSVASVTANGTTTVTSSAGFGSVFVGMLVFGTGVPANTVVVTWTSSSTLVLNNSVTAGTITLTFAHTGDMAYLLNGSPQSDLLLKVSSGFQIVTSSASAGAQTVGVRFAAQTALGTTVRQFIEAEASNANLAITGNNGGDGQSIHTLFTYHSLNNWTGAALSGTTRVGVNEDPFDFSGSVAASQPDSLIVNRRVGATSSVATVSLTSPTGVDQTTVAALATISSSSGSSPNKTAGAVSFFIRHDGQLRWGTLATSMSLVGSTTGAGKIVCSNNSGRTIFDWRSGVSAFADAVASCALFTSNTTDDSFRLLLGGDGGNTLARFGICATAVVIGVRTAGTLPAPAAGRILTLDNGTGSVAIDITLLTAARTMSITNNTGYAVTDTNIVVDASTFEPLVSDTGEFILTTL